MRISDFAPDFWLFEEEEQQEEKNPSEENPLNRYDVKNDNSKATDGDTRKPTLTLRAINKLKKIRAAKELEMAQKKELLGVMYGQPAGDDGGDMGGLPT